MLIEFRLVVIALMASTMAPDGVASSLTNEQTLKLLRQFEKQNSARLMQRHGVPLQIILHWEQDEIDWGLGQYLNDNAGGANVEGAAIRDDRLTSDGVLLALCHELGHLIRDRSRPTEFYRQVEFLTDYFATSDCFIDFLRAYPDLTDQQEHIEGSAPTAHYDRRCEAIFGQESDLCMRALRAAFSVSMFIGFARPDAKLPLWTAHAESSSDFLQCSLEAYVTGVFRDPLPECYFVREG